MKTKTEIAVTSPFDTGPNQPVIVYDPAEIPDTVRDVFNSNPTAVTVSVTMTTVPYRSGRFAIRHWKRRNGQISTGPGWSVWNDGRFVGSGLRFPTAEWNKEKKTV